ncbi:hypothetical protein ANN_17156 [Periplaneta americana]|uniref:Uncharacterized protein n=1 Tax=Periplaneta americana TaxID=6978 RepID=A0ABQ8SS53_PERAM|nr:hypothetical protein ANN_17156 [Periplaneta americana]
MTWKRFLTTTNYEMTGTTIAEKFSTLDSNPGEFTVAKMVLDSRSNRNDRDEIQTVEPFIPEPTLSEVEIAIKKLKKYKSPGMDQIPAELIQEGGSEYKTVILPVVLYGCETWTLTLRNRRKPLKLAIGIPLLQSLADSDRTISSLTSVPGNVGDKVNEKTANILSKNPGYYQLKEIQDILERKTPQKPTKCSIEQLTAFVQAPLTSYHNSSRINTHDDNDGGGGGGGGDDDDDNNNNNNDG